MLRDRKYLDTLRAMPCLICGATPSEPAHIGTAGKAVKSPDDEAIPLCHNCHAECHQRGEIETLRIGLPSSVLREALRAYARELFKEWSESARCKERRRC